MRLHIAGSAAIGKQPDRIAHIGRVAHRVLDGKLRREAHDIDARRPRVRVAHPRDRSGGSALLQLPVDKDLAAARLEAVDRRGAPGAALQRAERLRSSGTGGSCAADRNSPRQTRCAYGRSSSRRGAPLQARACWRREIAWPRRVPRSSENGMSPSRMADVVLEMQRDERVAHGSRSCTSVMASSRPSS